MRVLHVIHDLGPGGAEHVLADLGEVSSSAGFELGVVSLVPGAGDRYESELRGSGVEVFTLGLRGWWDPRATRRMVRVAADFRPALIHTHLKTADVVGGRAARRLRLPHVSTLHVMEEPRGRLGRWKRSLANRSRVRTAAITIAVSNALRDWYLSVSGAAPDRVVTVHNGVPDHQEGERTEVRSELGLADDEVAVAMVAVMRPGKGHADLLAAMRSVDPAVRLVLVGDGVLFDEVRRTAAALGDRVILTGFRDDVPRVLSGMDIVVHPTHADALPTALIHAIASGLPVIASRVGGVPEIVPEDAGVLLAPGDVDGLAGAIDRLARDSQQRLWMGKRAREHFEEEFTMGRWSKRLGDLYRTVLASTS